MTVLATVPHIEIPPEGTQVCYLLHFDRRYKHAGHYIGTTRDLARRLRQHARGEYCGKAARLMQVIAAEGIGFELARTWPGGRRREIQLKRKGGASRMCPLCGITPGTWTHPRAVA
jgi:predicted GIY-YIG superfamily endonuclease